MHLYSWFSNRLNSVTSNNLTISILQILFVLACACNSRNHDLSYYSNEYIEIGMPDHTTVWDLDDYVEAFIHLNKLKLQSPYSLPQKNSKKSGAYFERLISEENFAFLHDNRLSLSEKAYEIQNYSNIQSELIRFYTNMFSKAQFYRRELIAIYIFGIRISEMKLEVAGKIKKSEDPANKNMLYGISSVKNEFTQNVLHSLEIQRADSIYDQEDLDHLCLCTIHAIDRQKGWLDSLDIAKIRSHVQEVMKNTSSTSVKDHFRKLMDRQNW